MAFVKRVEMTRDFESGHVLNHIEPKSTLEKTGGGGGGWSSRPNDDISRCSWSKVLSFAVRVILSRKYKMPLICKNYFIFFNAFMDPLCFSAEREAPAFSPFDGGCSRQSSK